MYALVCLFIHVIIIYVICLIVDPKVKYTHINSTKIYV
jgi:hypothetical protein